MESTPLLRSLLGYYQAQRGDRAHKLALKNCFKEILQRNKINVLLDVGAHMGETGAHFRSRWNFQGRIVSFEPIHEKFLQLQKKASKDPLWDCHHLALGNETGEKKLTIFNNAYNSSFLKLHDFLAQECKLKATREELVRIQRLEDLYPTLCKPTDSVLLKIDTQGFEKPVLDGTGKCLPHVRLVKLEVSLVPLYKGETLIGEMIQYMGSKGFVPILIEPGHISEQFHQLQVDLIFLNQTPL